MSHNIAIVRGRLTSPPVLKELPSGAVLATLQVSSAVAGGAACSVPIAWWDPDDLVHALTPDDEVVVVGRVRRRFFRAGGVTASRVELEAEAVASVANRRRVRAMVRRAGRSLEAIAAAKADAGA